MYVAHNEQNGQCNYINCRVVGNVDKNLCFYQPRTCRIPGWSYSYSEIFGFARTSVMDWAGLGMGQL